MNLIVRLWQLLFMFLNIKPGSFIIFLQSINIDNRYHQT